jgi:hypothetical protein
MNQEDIIRMAREAGMYQDLNVSWTQSIQNFASLVAAAEREACAKVCVAVAERNIWWDINEIEAAVECAAAIRERGENV